MISRFLKRMARSIWHATAPIHVPIQHRHEAYLRRILLDQNQGGLDVVLQHLVREQAILREEIERLAHLVEQRMPEELSDRPTARERRAG